MPLKFKEHHILPIVRLSKILQNTIWNIAYLWVFNNSLKLRKSELAITVFTCDICTVLCSGICEREQNGAITKRSSHTVVLWRRVSECLVNVPSKVSDDNMSNNVHPKKQWTGLYLVTSWTLLDHNYQLGSYNNICS